MPASPSRASTTSPSSAPTSWRKASAPAIGWSRHVGGKAKIIELQGTTGSSPANDRKKGFDDAIKDHPGMEIVASQSGDFARDKGRQVAETLLQAHPEATAIYAHNDEMAMGAIAALEAAGKVPGKDVLIVSIDGTKDAIKRSSTARWAPPSSATRSSGRRRSTPSSATARARRSSPG